MVWHDFFNRISQRGNFKMSLWTLVNEHETQGERRTRTGFVSEIATLARLKITHWGNPRWAKWTDSDLHFRYGRSIPSRLVTVLAGPRQNKKTRSTHADPGSLLIPSVGLPSGWRLFSLDFIARRCSDSEAEILGAEWWNAKHSLLTISCRNTLTSGPKQEQRSYFLNLYINVH